MWEENGIRTGSGSDPVRIRFGPGPDPGRPGCCVPGPPLVGAAELGVVVELGEALLEPGPDRAALQVRHGQLVLLLHERLRSQQIGSDPKPPGGVLQEEGVTMVSGLSGSSSQAYGSGILVPW